jgi:hypothetical protein
MQAIKPNQRSIYRESSLVVILVAISISTQSCGTPPKSGAATPDRVVEQYLTALEKRNQPAIRRLMTEQSLATVAIKAKIDRLGGYQIQDRQIQYLKPKPSLWTANIRGFYVDRLGIKQQFNDSIVLVYQSKGELKLYAGRWYLVLD